MHLHAEDVSAPEDAGASRTRRSGGAPRGRGSWSAARALATLVLLLLAAAFGFSTAVGVALLVDHPALIIGAGLGAQAVVGWVALRWVWRPSAGRFRAAVAVPVGVVAAVSAAALLVPGGTGAPTPGVQGQAFWQLDTGSRIRVVRLPAATGPRRASPVVVLHGGPGVADMAGDAAYFRSLTGDGFDVYVHDQVGAGRSTRLTDPTGYAVDRDVADLEAIRRRIGVDRMILVGHSYGATLAGHYLARHPDRVARLVLISPGALDPDDTSDANLTARLSTPRRLRLYTMLAAPRPLLGYALLQVNPRAAHAYLPDAEADARNDEVYRATEPALHCTPAQARRPLRGTGFYALQYPQSATSPPRPDPRPAIDGLPTPTLVLKGSCDYLSWRSAIDYTATLPEATLLYYRGAGHNLAQDRPDDTLAAIRAFLTDAPLPQPAYRHEGAPADYQGPVRAGG